MTAHHIHDVPGRLRIRLPALKRNRDMAIRTESRVGHMSGVTSVQANPLTGSILVHYDPQATDACAILSAAGINRAQPDYHQSALERELRQARIARTVLVYALEKAVEVSVPLLIGAIL